MFKIDQHTIYTRADLKQELDPIGVTVDWFVQKYQPRKVFKNGWLGSDLIESIQPRQALVLPRDLYVGVSKGRRQKQNTGSAQLRQKRQEINAG